MDTAIKKRLSTRSASDIMFVCLLLLALALALWKLPYGLGGWDEAFYLDVPLRLTQGDALFKDEWHVSQLSAVLLTPFVSVYTALSGGTEGIMMAARQLYLLLQLLMAVFIYLRLRSSDFAGALAAVLYFLFVPLGIPALSYNSMGLSLVVLTGLILSSSGGRRPLPIILSGLLFAGAVLCNPFLLLAYLGFFLCMLLHCLLKRKNINNPFFMCSCFEPRSFLYFTLGAAAAALIFFAYLFSKIGLGDMLLNIPRILDDPEHTRLSLWAIVPSYFKYIIISSPLFGLSFVLFILLCAVLLFDKRRRERRLLYFILSCCCTALGLLGFSRGLLTEDYFNNLAFPPIYMGLVSFILSDKKDWRLFACLFCLGLCYSFAMFLSSNQYMVVISMALCASDIAGAVFIRELIKELSQEARAAGRSMRPALILLSLTLLLQLSLQTLVAARFVYWEESPEKLSAELSGGPADSIRTNPRTASRYQAFLSDIEESLSGHAGEKVLFLSPDTMFYLMAGELRCSAFSAWTSGEDWPVLEKLIGYYELNPEKIPNIVYIPKETSYYDYIDEISQEYAAKGFTAEESSMATILFRGE